ncbi:MAG: c-type cytochrome, partial [Nitrospirota bacterium]|nr:c-type cytochrome [Nitrospirota bacterium]
ERPDYIAPSLSSAGDKVNREWLVQWLQDPRKYLLNTKMPRFSRPVEEIENIADYLISLRTSAGAKGDTAGQPDTASINEGRDLVNSLGCTGCHIINGKGSSFAPELSRIGEKVKREWLVQWLKDPAGYPQNIAMPDLSLNDNEARSITAYLMTLKSPVPASAINNVNAAQEGSAAKGRKLVKDLGCTGCHEIEKLAAGFDAPQLDGIGDKSVDELVFGNIRGIEKTRINWLQIKVSDPGKFATDRIITRMPNYSFSREQSEDLTIFLLGLKKSPLPRQYTKKLLHAGTAETAGKSVMGKYNCLGCHRTGSEGGNIGPDLTGEAKKSRPEWLFNFLKKPYKIRTGQMLRAKMPDFRLSDKEADAITGYLAVAAGESYPFSSTQKKEVMPEDVSNGERLYREIFACSACHKLNNTGGQVGPDHSDIASRLKREWIERWLRDPQAVTPGVIMPRFKFRDWEFEALTDYLMTLGNYRFITVRERE